jgi:hypothetical protein
LLNSQRFNELIEKDWDAVIWLIASSFGFRPARDHGTALINQDRAVRLEKLVEHPSG